MIDQSPIGSTRRFSHAPILAPGEGHVNRKVPDTFFTLESGLSAAVTRAQEAQGTEMRQLLGGEPIDLLVLTISLAAIALAGLARKSLLLASEAAEAQRDLRAYTRTCRGPASGPERNEMSCRTGPPRTG